MTMMRVGALSVLRVLVAVVAMAGPAQADQSRETFVIAGSPSLTVPLKALAEAYPSRDAPVVERLKRAGGIPLGHTNCPTIAVRWHTESEIWGSTVNPWNGSRTPGGSSGGEAAALATGMSPLGVGNDGLGSLRWSPDGARLALVSNRGLHSFVGVYDAASRRLTWMDPGVDQDGEPAWSPDGRQLAFLRLPTGFTPRLFVAEREGEPWSVRVADVAVPADPVDQAPALVRARHPVPLLRPRRLRRPWCCLVCTSIRSMAKR